MIKIILFGLLGTICFAEWACHYEAVTELDECPNPEHESVFLVDEYFFTMGGGADPTDYDFYGGAEVEVPDCPIDPNDAVEIYLNGTKHFGMNDSLCEADAKFFMAEYRDQYPAPFTAEFNASDWATRPEGTIEIDNCNYMLDIYYVRCVEKVHCEGSWGACSNDANCEQEYYILTAAEHGGDDCEAATGDKQTCDDDSSCPVTDVGGEDCKDLDESGCAAQPDSCHAKIRGGEFRKCKPKRCKPMTESQCEAAVHCEAKNGRRGEYKRCRRIDSSRASIGGA